MSDLEESSDIYIVKKLVGFRYRGKTPEWRVRWQGYGPKDDTWETRKNLLMDNRFAFKHQMDAMEKEYLQRRAGGRQGRGLCCSAVAARGNARHKAGVSAMPDEEQGSHSDSSSSSSSGGDTSDSDCSFPGARVFPLQRHEGVSPKKRLRRRRRCRCINNLMLDSPPINGRPPRLVDPGLPASSDSDMGAAAKGLQRRGGEGWGCSSLPSADQYVAREKVRLVSPQPLLLTPKKYAARGITPLRRLRLPGLEGAPQAVCRSDGSGVPSRAPSSSCKSSPDRGTVGGPPGAPTGFTVNEASDEEVGPPFLNGLVRGFSLPTQQQQQQHFSRMREGARGAPVPSAVFLSPSPYGTPAARAGREVSPAWAINRTDGDRFWSEGGWGTASGGHSEALFTSHVPALPSHSNWTVGGRLQEAIATPDATSTGALGPPEGPPSPSRKQETPLQYVVHASSPQTQTEGPSGPFRDASSGPPTAAFTPTGSTQLSLMTRPIQQAGGGPAATLEAPLGQPGSVATAATAAGGETCLCRAETLEQQQQQQQQLELQQHQQQQLELEEQEQMGVLSSAPLGMAKGVLNRYPCESLFPGRVRVVRMVRGDKGTEAGVRGAIVHYVIQGSPGTDGDPSRNVWGCCSVPDARRFCPGALCDYLLRKALFRTGDSQADTQKRKDSTQHAVSTRRNGETSAGSPSSFIPTPDGVQKYIFYAKESHRRGTLSDTPEAQQQTPANPHEQSLAEPVAS